MKTLCLYYTRTNTTKEVMENIAKELNADIAEYTDGKERSGFLGYISACFVSVKKSVSKVNIKGDVDLKKYDRVVIGMPVWVEGPCAIGKAFIQKFRHDMPAEVYYVVTHMGKNGYMPKIKALDNLLGKESKGQFSVRTKENDYISESKNIANRINQ